MTQRPLIQSFFSALSVASLLLLCIGCVSTPPVDNIPPLPRVADAPPEHLTPHLDPYRLQIGDVIDIKLMLNPEMNDEATVQPDGYISTSLAQNVEAYGHTTTELQKSLVKLYKSQLKNPHLTVVVRSFAPNRVYVLGEVNQPGEFITIGPNLTILQAIARAGGVKNSADPHTLVILRHTEGSEPKVYASSYKDAVSGADPASDARLQPYDVVYVPRSDVGDAYLNFQQYFQEFVPSSFGAVYQINSPGAQVP